MNPELWLGFVCGLFMGMVCGAALALVYVNGNLRRW